MPRLIELTTRTGEPYTVGATVVTPQSQALIIQLPFFRFVWNRPIAVLVDRAGQTERLPIVDITRYAVWGLMAFSAVMSMLLMATAARRGKEHNERVA